MNATLYLPAKVIQTIISTDKHIIFVHKCPRHYIPKKDNLLIYEEETGNFFGTVRSPLAYSTSSFVRNWWKLRSKIAYMDKGFFSYLFSKRKFYIFVFTSAIRFH